MRSSGRSSKVTKAHRSTPSCGGAERIGVAVEVQPSLRGPVPHAIRAPDGLVVGRTGHCDDGAIPVAHDEPDRIRFDPYRQRPGSQAECSIVVTVEPLEPTQRLGCAHQHRRRAIGERPAWAPAYADDVVAPGVDLQRRVLVLTDGACRDLAGYAGERLE